MAFHPHENGPDLQRFYVTNLNRPDSGGDWSIQIIRLHAAQYLENGSGIHVTGLLDPSTVELLYNSVVDLWTTALGTEFTITTIDTTRMPESFCDHALNQIEVEGVWYEVYVADQKLPEGPVLPAYPYAVGIVESGPDMDRARAGKYKFTFREDTNGYPEFVTVECATIPDFCDEKLATLKTFLGSDAEEDTNQRDDAIMAVLPVPYTKDHIAEIQLSTGNGRENIVVDLADVAVSATRSVGGVVICRRALGSMEDWECEYRFRYYNQVLANGMTVMVRTLDLDEFQVESMVAEVEEDIINARIVRISGSDSEYTLTSSGFDFPTITAHFDANLNLTEKVFRER